jgi:hypothetical protein
MSERLSSTEDQYEPGSYEIRIKGHLDNQWTDWFGGLTLMREDSGDTLLTGMVADQAALHGLLRKIRDLGMTLIAVNRIGPNQSGKRSGPNEKIDGKSK